MNIDSVLRSSPTDEVTNNGVSHSDEAVLAEHLRRVLANTYVLNVKTQNFHWNAVGPLFYGLHNLTEEQYKDLTESIDVIAERMRAIGFVATGAMESFLNDTDIIEEVGRPSGEEMVKQLATDNELCSRRLREGALLADKLEDVKTADLLTERVGVHEHNAWMLRSILA